MVFQQKYTGSIIFKRAINMRCAFLFPRQHTYQAYLDKEVLILNL